MIAVSEIFHQDVEEEVTCATFSDDLEILVLGFDNGLVSIYNVVKSRHAADLEPSHSASVTALAISPNSKWISVGRATGSLANFLTRTAYLEQVVIGHKSLVHSVQISANSQLTLSASACGACIVYSIEKEKLLFLLKLERPCLSVSMSFDNQVIAVGTSSGDVVTCLWQLPPDDSEVASRLAACRQQERRLKSRAKFYSTLNRIVYRGHGRNSSVTAVAFARRSRIFATGGSFDRRVTLADWDSLTQLMCVDNAHSSWIVGLRWSPLDECLASWAEHDCLRLWRRRPGSPADFSPQSEIVADFQQMCSVFYCSVDPTNSPVATVASSGSCNSTAAQADFQDRFKLDDRDFEALSWEAEKEDKSVNQELGSEDGAD